MNFSYFSYFYLEEIQIFINYTRDLRFDDRPDYGFLKRLIKTISEKEKIEFDFNFEWNSKKLENVIIIFFNKKIIYIKFNLILFYLFKKKVSETNIQSNENNNKDSGNILGTNKANANDTDNLKKDKKLK